MYNGKYVSLYNIIEMFMRDTKYTKHANIGDLVEWAGEAIELLAVPMALKPVTTCITLENFRAKIPCDLRYIRGLRDFTTKEPFRYTTDSFHNPKVQCDCDDHVWYAYTDATYNMSDDYIFTDSSHEEGTLEISYWAIPIDDNGFPLIPDEIAYRKAVKAYIEQKVYFIKLEEGTTTQYIYEKKEQEACWYIGKAQNAGKINGVDHMESIKNAWLRLIPKINEHANAFRTLGHAEQRIVHNAKLCGTSSGSSTSNDTETYFNYTDSAT